MHVQRQIRYRHAECKQDTDETCLVLRTFEGDEEGAESAAVGAVAGGTSERLTGPGPSLEESGKTDLGGGEDGKEDDI